MDAAAVEEVLLEFPLLYHASQFLPVTLGGLLLLVVKQVSLSDATRIRGVQTTPSPS